jgi:hypothetical protein
VGVSTGTRFKTPLHAELLPLTELISTRVVKFDLEFQQNRFGSTAPVFPYKRNT